jgi:hypothetical protein
MSYLLALTCTYTVKKYKNVFVRNVCLQYGWWPFQNGWDTVNLTMKLFPFILGFLSPEESSDGLSENRSSMKRSFSPRLNEDVHLVLKCKQQPAGCVGLQCVVVLEPGGSKWYLSACCFEHTVLNLKLYAHVLNLVVYTVNTMYIYCNSWVISHAFTLCHHLVIWLAFTVLTYSEHKSCEIICSCFGLGGLHCKYNVHIL